MPALPEPAPTSIAIIGGGWAGLACALKLAEAGYQPVVFESAPEVGGRARGAWIEDHGRDNGQHLILAGCQAVSALLQAADIQLPTVPFTYQSGHRALAIPARAGRLGLLIALLRAKGFSLHERFRLSAALFTLQKNGWTSHGDTTVAAWLQQTRQPAALIESFWAPLALGILNTPIESAAMSRLIPVLRDTLGMGGHALRIVQPDGNLTDSIVTPLVNKLAALGGSVRCHHRIQSITQGPGGLTLGSTENTNTELFDQVVLALPPWSLAKLSLPLDLNPNALMKRFGAQPLATVYLGFANDFRLPSPLLQLAGPTPEDARIWAIDRAHCGEPGVIAISVSAQGPWCQLSREALAEACLAALQSAIVPTPHCLWKKAVIVQRATYAATPAAKIKPGDLEPLPNLYLAGDWTHPDYPATLEAAVQSGFRTAARIVQKLA